VSEELTHFLGRALPSNEEKYALLAKILREGRLTHPPHDPTFSGNLTVNPHARISSNEMYSPQVVCFCDIPVSDLGIHVEKYGPFGIAFPKATLVDRGANPVFYVANPSQIPQVFLTDIMRDPKNLEAKRFQELLEQTVDRGSTFDRGLAMWHRTVERLQALMVETRKSSGTTPDVKEFTEFKDLIIFLEFHLFSFIKCFDPGLDDTDSNNFYMEREWRVLGSVEFNLADVSRVLLPPEFARRLRTDVPEYVGQVEFSP
jgi:hypothetical protein